MSCLVAEYVRENLPMIDEKTPVIEVVQQMCEKQVTSAIVTSAGEVVGIFTEGDLMKRVVNAGRDATELKVGEVCTRQLVSIEADAACDTAILKMRSNACRRLAVYRGPRFLGLVKIHDLALAMASATRQRSSVLNVFVWATLALVLGLVVMLLLQLPQVLDLVQG
ncbi:MAG: CBS domain-containing protein [Gammaproteobacteria bacterium]|nr:CBS domain-containing protein [Gammaproteobacteria bacterium]